MRCGGSINIAEHFKQYSLADRAKLSDNMSTVVKRTMDITKSSDKSLNDAIKQACDELIEEWKND